MGLAGIKRVFTRGRVSDANGRGTAANQNLGRRLGVWSALGVLAAAILGVTSNLLGARFYHRWDVTPAGLYTLSPASRETLDGLSERVQILVFLGRADPQLGGVKRLLAQYSAVSRLLDVRYIDPDRNPTEFMALQNRYRLTQGRAEAGHLVSDAAIVVARGDARWVIGSEDIVSYDEEHGTVKPRLEAALTEGLRQVLDPRKTEVCFSQGHDEPSTEDGGASGLGALRYALEKNNYGTRDIDLGTTASELGLERCDLAIVVAPGQAFPPAVAARLIVFVQRGKSVLIAAGPSLGEDNRAVANGLEPVLAEFGVKPRQQLIFERDPDLALPVGVAGEVFLATPKPHLITRGMLDKGEARMRVLMQVAQGFEATGPAAPLLATSAKAFAVGSAAALAAPGAKVADVEHDAEGPFVVALAGQLESRDVSRPGARLVVLGSSSPLLGGTWQDQSLAGTRRFIESALAWLVSRPALVNINEKPARQVDLRFTEQSMLEVARYVLIYMPFTALGIGVLVLYRRRFARAASRPKAAP
jgi:hypothetical protein